MKVVIKYEKKELLPGTREPDCSGSLFGSETVILRKVENDDDDDDADAEWSRPLISGESTESKSKDWKTASAYDGGSRIELNELGWLGLGFCFGGGECTRSVSSDVGISTNWEDEERGSLNDLEPFNSDGSSSSKMADICSLVV